MTTELTRKSPQPKQNDATKFFTFSILI